MHTKGEWKQGWGTGIAGGTCPTTQPFCGGVDWPFMPITGQDNEVICLVPAADINRQIGKGGEPNPATMEANAHLISASPDLYEALREAKLEIEYLHSKFGETGTGNKVLSQIEQALAKAK